VLLKVNICVAFGGLILRNRQIQTAYEELVRVVLVFKEFYIAGFVNIGIAVFN